ncbi:hypothetical protein ACWGKW_25175 [Streptomyces sp. NPDC054766]
MSRTDEAARRVELMTTPHKQAMAEQMPPYPTSYRAGCSAQAHARRVLLRWLSSGG